jgi:PAS domain S-box-containing protein
MSLADEGAIARTTSAGGRRRDYPIAVHLMLFAAGTLMPVLLIVAVMLLDTARLWRDDSLQDARVIVQHLNATIEVELEKAINVSQTLATALALDEPDHVRFEAQARDAAKRLGENIVVRDLKGQQIVNTTTPAGSPLPRSNETALAMDRLAAETKAPVISDIRVATMRGVPVVNAVVPVVKNGDVAWLISVSLSPEGLSQILAANLPDGWIAGVIGRDGHLIARSVDLGRYIGTVNGQFVALATASEGDWTGTTREGVAIAGVYVRSPLSGWVVSVAVPETILRAPARQAMAWWSGLAATAVVLSSLLGWHMSRRISLPIRELVARARDLGARDLGEGRAPGGSPSSVAEINNVTGALLAAAGELDRRTEAANDAAAAVLASEARFRGIFENAAVGVALIALDGRYLLVNQRICELIGFSADEMLTKTIKDVTWPPDFEDNLTQGRNILAGEMATFTTEKRYVRKDGGTIWCGLTVSLQTDRSGAPEYFIAIVRDVSMRRRAQEELRDRLREIEALYNNAPVGLMVIDRDRRVLRMNQAVAEMNGLPADEYIGRLAWDVVPARQEVLDPKIAEVLATGQTVDVELSGEIPGAPGETRFWHEKIYPIREPDGRVTAVGIVVEDITAQKRAEEHLRFLLRELSHRSKNLLAVIQAMAGQTAKSAETVGEFRRRFGERLMGMAASHDLLVNQNWLGASVEQLVRGQLSAFIDGDDPRLSVQGPEVDLKSEAAEALGLALHELATNSLKYGALSDPAGKVEILWAAPEGRRFRMDWIEHTVSPVSRPSHKGFGRMVIEHTVEASLGGTVTLDFPPGGLRWHIEAPGSCLASGLRSEFREEATPHRS